MRKWFVILLLAQSLSLVSTGVAAAQPAAPLGALTAGLAINALADRLDSSIERGATNIDRLRIQAGGEVWAAINNFRIAYADMLNRTVEQLDQKAKDNIARIRSAVEAIERNAAADAEVIARLATQGLLIVPLSNKQSQVTRWSPGYEIFRVTDDFVTLTLQGVFAYAMEPGFRPTIKLGDRTLEPVHATTQDLIFQIPRLALRPSDASHAFAKIPVSIPYRKSRLLFGSKRVEAEFVIGIVGLPAMPGKIVLQNTTPITVADLRKVRTIQFNQQSDRDDHDLNHCGPVEDPWVINASTVRFVVDRSEGSTFTHNPVRINNPSVCWHLRTEHHGAGTSDKVWFHFEYEATSSHTDQNVTSLELDLRWGDSKTFPITANHWKLTFDAFDGTHTEIAAPDHANRYLDVDLQGNSLRVLVRSVDDIPGPRR